ncbi:MAG TPA: hypothetical protein VG734_07295 [Lacunisphaera sp.]|nr:hypothetical protein [Lacunisphaera sp.]
MPSVTTEKAAQAAGYFLPEEDAERGIRNLLHTHSGSDDEALKLIRHSIKAATGGVVLTEDEIVAFIDGYRVKEILAARIANSGNIRQPHDTSEGAFEESTRDESGRETAFCSSCDQMRPITFGYVNRPTLAATIDLGGPVDLTRITSDTDEQTFCAVCGHRVYTSKECRALEEKEKNDNIMWLVMWGAGAIVVVIVGLMIASLPS